MTFPELIIAMVIGIITVGTTMVVLQMAMRTEPELRERSGQVQQGRVFVERITRELRQGELVTTASGSGLEIVTYVHSSTCGGAAASTTIACRVTYTCSTTACTRLERNPDGTGTSTSQTAVSGITGPAVFSFSPSSVDPSYVTVSLIFPAENGEEAVTVSDGVSLRNHFEGAGA